MMKKDQKKLKATIEKEIRQLVKEFDAGTLDQNSLESGLKKLEKYVFQIPWFRFDVDDDD
jgi:hypothetical protein